MDYDKALRSVLEKITNHPLDEDSWHQSSLPVSMGGLGIRQSVDTAIPSFLASYHSCKNLVDQILPPHISSNDEAAIEATSKWIQQGQEIPPDDVITIQAHWESQKFKTLYLQLLSRAADDVSKARLLASASPHSGDWLQAIPSPQLGTLMSDECFRIATALRIGGETGQPHTCPCGADVSTLGHHGLSCQRSAGRLSRHATVNDVIKRALQTAEVPSIKEPMGCARNDGRKPDGLTLIPWEKGRCMVWDFTCRDTFAPSYLKSTSIRVGHAARLGESDKHKLYADLEGRYILVPVAIETTGVFGEEGLKLLKSIGKRITEVTGERRATQYLLQRISIALQRGNTASILGTLPAGKELDEVYYL
jgi:hypothetical protein